MILYKLKVMECELATNNSQKAEKIKAITVVKDLLLQINYKAEVIPESSYTGLNKLLKKLKGAELSEEEKIVLKEII
jgi:hypothetical protein